MIILLICITNLIIIYMNKNKEVLVPMTPQQYEYWKAGLNKIEN